MSISREEAVKKIEQIFKNLDDKSIREMEERYRGKPLTIPCEDDLVNWAASNDMAIWAGINPENGQPFWCGDHGPGCDIRNSLAIMAGERWILAKEVLELRKKVEDLEKRNN